MLGHILIGALASIFYYIGDNDYAKKGWVLALASVVFSIAGLATGLSLIGLCGANALLYLFCLAYNLLSKEPPSSSSGW